MRLRPIVLAVLLAAGAWSAQAQPEADEARDHFEAALSNDCPQKQLQLLSARNLRDGLDSYIEGLPQDVMAIEALGNVTHNYRKEWP